eukprot:CAMPEP_0115041066 /NCGR_PEP_ID=MMETSP0216-20121206/45285_1 /TAXON_ID=223996 /ORGANISM="Protocruzia adherens, Strain Boccale" /LENGTH=115 /DNA_ID=CAMNT_0002422591 /DNA_START=535 /DNA_END=882 /DNA_ORIENTATION=-
MSPSSELRVSHDPSPEQSRRSKSSMRTPHMSGFVCKRVPQTFVFPDNLPDFDHSDSLEEITPLKPTKRVSFRSQLSLNREPERRVAHRMSRFHLSPLRQVQSRVVIRDLYDETPK